MKRLRTALWIFWKAWREGTYVILSEDILYGRHKWIAVRDTYIPKPLGVLTGYTRSIEENK